MIFDRQVLLEANSFQKRGLSSKRIYQQRTQTYPTVDPEIGTFRCVCLKVGDGELKAHLVYGYLLPPSKVLQHSS